MGWLSDAIAVALTSLIIICGKVLFWFDDLAWTTSNWIRPFNRLSEPMFKFAYWVGQTAYRIGDVKREFEHYTDFLNELWGLSGLNKLLNWIWWEWDSLKNDPKLFISEKLDDIIPEFWKLRTMPWAWVKSRVYVSDPDLWPWLNDPLMAFKFWLSKDLPRIYDLIWDTTNGLLSIIDAFSHQAYLLFTDPIGYVKELFIVQLGWSYQFWLDPWGYIFDELSTYIDQSVVTWGPKLAHVGERVIRYIWEGRF